MSVAGDGGHRLSTLDADPAVAACADGGAVGRLRENARTPVMWLGRLSPQQLRMSGAQLGNLRRNG